MNHVFNKYAKCHIIIHNKYVYILENNSCVLFEINLDNYNIEISRNIITNLININIKYKSLNDILLTMHKIIQRLSIKYIDIKTLFNIYKIKPNIDIYKQIKILQNNKNNK